MRIIFVELTNAYTNRAEFVAAHQIKRMERLEAREAQRGNSSYVGPALPERTALYFGGFTYDGDGAIAEDSIEVLETPNEIIQAIKLAH